jgi:XTP/dITP diphosphohydrolase
VPPSRPLYLATKNAGKIEEFRALLAGSAFVPAVYDAYADPVEGERDYAENAALKARALHGQLRAAGIDAAVLADDSGLEVDALDGRPGVVTADYGGAGLSWAQRRRVVLDELDATGSADRRARFVCYLHFIAADGREFAVRGSVDGRIATEDRGDAGFSFDPIFVYPPARKTFAELDADEKNAVSHRRHAVNGLLRRLAGCR